MKYADVVGICDHKDSGESQYTRKQEKIDKGYDDKVSQYGIGDRQGMEFANGKSTQYRK